MTPRLVISVGCPSGIGPEVALVAAAKERRARILLVGDLGALQAAARIRGIDPTRLVAVDEPAAAFARAATGGPRGRLFVHAPGPKLRAEDRAPGRSSRAGGAAQLRWIDAATDLVAAGIADALVTGPASKDAIARSGAPASRGFRGHTEHLADRLGASEVTMAFWTERLTTALVTTHLPLARVPKAITVAEVARAIYWTSDLVLRLGDATRAIATCGLNPHAGEAGLLGDEEETRIKPGMKAAARRLRRAGLEIALEGPVPAESAFRLAAAGRFAAVVAMYHDQATIPMKLLGFGEAVNVTLGLPIVRTSVDHGTAYDRAGTGTADARGMSEAIGLAIRLVESSALRAQRR